MDLGISLENFGSVSVKVPIFTSSDLICIFLFFLNLIFLFHIKLSLCILTICHIFILTDLVSFLILYILYLKKTF